jgi:hypothetical protein
VPFVEIEIAQREGSASSPAPAACEGQEGNQASEGLQGASSTQASQKFKELSDSRKGKRNRDSHEGPNTNQADANGQPEWKQYVGC